MDLNRPLVKKIEVNVGKSKYHVHEELLRKLQNYALDWIQDYHQGEDWMENEDLRYAFEMAKGDGGYVALAAFFAAMLRQKSAEDHMMARDFLQAVPALGPYLYYESVCGGIDQLRFNPKYRDHNHLLEAWLAFNQQIFLSLLIGLRNRQRSWDWLQLR
ncbi:uncharacterized protein EAE97_006386 [Botrytis byssoidea]|uniref:Uncharacterized protein n=1 Tax=Botrytis byssoidea TaxID=139641 RepID=A0A9P5IPR9_9HELO|nr:uncharacterized protein EAE97_006386 [Botrytis byssoidea]KAF7942932.1 hypothetical protein EAE97_006386 [Botrytis byssoidea]